MHISAGVRTAAVASAVLIGASACGSSAAGGARDAIRGATGETPSGSASASPSPSAADNTALSARTLAERALTAVRTHDVTLSVSYLTEDGDDMEADGCIGANQDYRIVGTVTGEPLEMLRLGEYTYMKTTVDGYAAFYGEGLSEDERAAVADGLDGRYARDVVEDGDEVSAEGFADFFGGSADLAVKGEPTTIGTARVIPVSVTYEDGAVTTLYVTADGEPFPLRVTERPGTDSRERNDAEFALASKPCEVAAPPAADIVD